MWRFLEYIFDSISRFKFFENALSCARKKLSHLKMDSQKGIYRVIFFPYHAGGRRRYAYVKIFIRRVRLHAFETAGTSRLKYKEMKGNNFMKDAQDGFVSIVVCDTSYVLSFRWLCTKNIQTNNIQTNN